jgi:predicted NAD/FAD-dependent oxidoreductase
VELHDIVIIGAGMAGLAAARALKAAGRGVVLYDKGRKPGGRLATRRGAVTFNHGCQFLTLRDPAFRATMLACGAVPWGAAGQGCHVGVPDMASLAETFAAGLPVRLEHQLAEANYAGHWSLRFTNGTAVTSKNLILAIPAPQAAVLIPELAPHLAGVRMAPCWTVMLTLPPNTPGPDLLRPSQNPLAWISRENARPGATQQATAYTIQASAPWSTAHLEDAPETVTETLTAAFWAATSIPPAPFTARAHRWRYALAETPLGNPYIWEPETRLGLCGDWCLAGRLEAAFLSGHALGIYLGDDH